MTTSEIFDCFLSHNSKDKPAVRALAQRLRARGISVWLDQERLQPGIPWQPLLEAGIRESRSVAVLVGGDGIGPWESEEIRAALSLAVRDKRPVIPVLLPDAPAAPELPLFLLERTWVDLRLGGDDESKFDQIVWGITGSRPKQRPTNPASLGRGRNDVRAPAHALHEPNRVTIITIITLLVILALPFALDRMFSLQPPWPNHSAFITGVLALCVLVFSRSATASSTNALRRFKTVALVLLIALFFLYFLLYSTFVFETPLTGERVVAGFRCSEEALIVSAQLRESCPFLSEKALAAAQYETEVVWTPLSVKTVKFMLFACWTSFFLLATGFLACTLQYLRKRRS